MHCSERLFSLRQKKIGMINKQDIEILAPCGSYEILIAAVQAGADACYMGGNRFGARAYAQNFDEKDMVCAIEYAHMHGVRVYLTLNTLIKEEEFLDAYKYLRTCYEAGLDAVIVQDLGLFRMVRNCFADLPVHCSTQMNVTSYHSAKLLADMGATRVVTAREMSLEEIRHIKEQVDIEVETFVHGAMCYSYSGQCLMSSLAGGRSGNRGRCAQPCRKCYDGNYLLSMKDLCGLSEVPALLSAGVDSLKIEGRMKNAAYVASAVHAYKEVADAWKESKECGKTMDELQFELANVFNRGGFTKGYFHQRNGRDMMSLERPNNRGVKIGTLLRVQDGTVHIKLCEELYKQDVLELSTKSNDGIEITSAVDAKANSVVQLKCPKTKLLKPGQSIYRTKSNQILEHIQSSYIDAAKGQAVDGYLKARIKEPFLYRVSTNLFGSVYEGWASAGIVEKASSGGWNREKVEKPLGQLGDTGYFLNNLEIEADEDSFMPVGVLKQLRRTAIANLEETVRKSFARTVINEQDITKLLETDSPDSLDMDSNRKLYIGVSTMEQLQVVCDLLKEDKLSIQACMLDSTLCDSDKLDDCLAVLESKHVIGYLETPHVIREGFCLEDYLPRHGIRGIYIKNIEALALLRVYTERTKYHVLCDSSLYCYNLHARAFVRECLTDVESLQFVAPREMNEQELRTLRNQDMVMTVYEYAPVMLSANCVQKTKYGCKKEHTVCEIKDDKGNRFFAKAMCRDCYNVIYNGVVYECLDACRKGTFDDMASSFILRFTIEEATTLRKLLCEGALPKSEQQRTSGHLYRGVL